MFVVLKPQGMFLRGGEVWRQRYLVPQRQYVPYLHYPSNLSLHCILSFDQGDNYSPYYRNFAIIQLPYKYPRTWAPRPCWHYCLFPLLISFAFHFFVYCLLTLRTWGFTSQYYFFLSFVYLAIRTLGTLPRTWAPLRGTKRTEHYITFCLHRECLLYTGFTVFRKIQVRVSSQQVFPG